MTSTNEITHEFPPFFRVYRDGRIERLFATPRVPPTTDPKTGIQSKDILISSDPEIKARVFIPKISASDSKKIPLIIYYHGGGFCIGSAFNIVTQNFITSLITQKPAIVIAVGYRLAPEHPLPIAFEDSWTAFKWIAHHSTREGPDPWINEYADFERVFLAGESAGANLAHNVAVRAGVTGVTGLELLGLIAVHPFFAQKEPDKMIQYLYPTSSGSDDDPTINPGADPDLEKLGCSRVLVLVAERDYLKPRGVGYYETLKKSKWGGSVEFVETEGEDHVFHLFNPTSDKAVALIHKLASFLAQEN